MRFFVSHTLDFDHFQMREVDLSFAWVQSSLFNQQSADNWQTMN